MQVDTPDSDLSTLDYSDLAGEDFVPINQSVTHHQSRGSGIQRLDILRRAIRSQFCNFFDFGNVIVESEGRAVYGTDHQLMETQQIIAFAAQMANHNANYPVFTRQLKSKEDLKGDLIGLGPVEYFPGDSSIPGFEVRKPRDDPEMVELLTTVPNSLKLVLREWVHKRGVGDFVFRFRYEGAYHFLVAEVKKSGRNVKQLELSATSFNSHYRMMYVHAQTSIWKVSLSGNEPFNLEYHSGPNSIEIKAFLRGTINSWYKNYTALRCAETD